MEQDTQAKAGASSSLPGKRFLVVCGGPVEPWTVAFADRLGREGLAVEQASGAARAVAAVGRQSFHAAFVCVGSEGAEGCRMVARLRAAAPDLALIVLSAAPSPSVSGAVLRAGAQDCLQAPAGAEALQAVLRCADEARAAQAARLLQAMTRLMPGLVHELRNPLSGVLGAGQMLTRLLPADGTAREYAEMIRDEAVQMERFLARLAEFGRLRPGQMQRVPGVDFVGLVERTLHELAPACRAQGVQVLWELAAEVPPVCGDAARLQRACTEIIQNALEAMPKGGSLRVRVRLLSDAGPEPTWLEAVFADEGAGLGPEAFARVGEPFFSTRPRALGVGVCLAQAVLLGHGGSLAVEPGPAGGTEVRMRLPLSDAMGEA